MTSIGKRKAEKIVSVLKEVRRISTMEQAVFHDPETEAGSRAWWNTDAYTKGVRESTRIWRSSWIIGPLDEVIEMLEEGLAQ